MPDRSEYVYPTWYDRLPAYAIAETTSLRHRNMTGRKNSNPPVDRVFLLVPQSTLCLCVPSYVD